MNTETGQFMGIGMFLWLSALCAFLLLILSGSLGKLFSGKGSRLARAAVTLAICVLALAPPIFAVATHDDLGFGLVVYVVIFALFCYVLGTGVGWQRGRKHLSEIIGIDATERLEDVQDRLFESSMRLATRSDVVKSIGELAKAQEEKHQARERGDTAVEVEVEHA